jgi:hypothetical protein
MDTLIKSYQPIRSEDELYLWIGAVVALLAFGAMGFVMPVIRIYWQAGGLQLSTRFGQAEGIFL